MLAFDAQGFVDNARRPVALGHIALQKKEPSWLMIVPLVILAVLAVLLGMFPNGLVGMIQKIAVTVM